MFLIRWIAILVSLPLYLLGLAGAMFKFPPAVQLLRAAYIISGDQAQGLAALSHMAGLLGPDAAAAQARKWSQTRPGPDVLAFAGLSAVDAHDLIAARDLHTRSIAMGRDRTGLQEMLEFYITIRGGDRQAVDALLERLSARRDLSGQASLFLENYLVSHDMDRGQFDAARRRAIRLLAIEENPDAHVKLWAMDLRAGDAVAADRHLKAVNLPPAHKLPLQIAALAAAGDKDAARRLIDEFREYDTEQADTLQRAIDIDAQRLEARP